MVVVMMTMMRTARTKILLISLCRCFWAEVFDAGLIGEGALHMFAAVQRNLVAESYELVPSSATVYFQLLEMRTGVVRGFDMSQLNRFRWRPDYEGMDLASQMGERWSPLSDVHEVVMQYDTSCSRHLSVLKRPLK